MKIDSHQHFWRYDAVRHEWITDSMAVLKRDFLSEHLTAELAANDMDSLSRMQSREKNGCSWNEFLSWNRKFAEFRVYGHYTRRAQAHAIESYPAA